MENKINLKRAHVKSINSSLNIGSIVTKNILVVNIARGSHIVAGQAANINSIFTTF